jgi:hypothetical protein
MLMPLPTPNVMPAHAGIQTATMRAMFVAILCVACAVPANAQTPADPVAVLVQTTGDIHVRRGASAEPSAAAIGTALQAGDEVLVPAGARAVVLHSTGRVDILDRPTRIQAPDGERSDAFARTIETLAQIATTDARSQPNRQGMIRPIPGTPVPISPRNGIAILDRNPAFTWFSVPDAGSYIVQIRERDGEPRRFQAGRDTVWTLPDTLALEAGTEYEWTMGVSVDGRTAPVQHFRIATAEERLEIDRRLCEMRGRGLDPDADGLFLAALAYRGAGFLYDANAALDRLQLARGAGGRAYHTLRGEIYDALGRVDQAAREFALADAEPSP